MAAPDQPQERPAPHALARVLACSLVLVGAAPWAHAGRIRWDRIPPGARPTVHTALGVIVLVVGAVVTAALLGQWRENRRQRGSVGRSALLAALATCTGLLALAGIAAIVLARCR